eukprot:5800516-Amphidinium_carterae.2
MRSDSRKHKDSRIGVNPNGCKGYGLDTSSDHAYEACHGKFQSAFTDCDVFYCPATQRTESKINTVGTKCYQGVPLESVHGLPSTPIDVLSSSVNCY